MAAEIGVDRLCWELTDHPENMFSRRFVPGTAEHARIEHEIWDDNNLGNAIPGATPRAQHRRRAALASRACRSWRGAGRPVSRRDRAEPVDARRFRAQATYGRRLVRLGAQLCDRDGTVINRDYERAWLPAHLQPGARSKSRSTITAPEKPGRYALEVRSRQRRHRLVRGLRLADHDRALSRCVILQTRDQELRSSGQRQPTTPVFRGRIV